MKNLKKIASLVLALVMVFSLAITVSAAGTGTITINNAQKGNIYKIYKVFDADGNGSGISYSVKDSKAEDTLPACFEVDNQGNISYVGTGADGQLTADDIAEIAAYVGAADLVDTKTADGETVTVTGLDNGYYYITTTTGTVVSVTSTNPNATTTDKNNPPEDDKVITGASSYDEDGKKALAQVGTDVTYTVTIDVKAGAVGYVFHDVMDNRLSYNADSLSIKVGGAAVDAESYDTTTADGDTITVKFNDEWIKDQVGKTITISYTAKITAEALNDNPAKNTATLDYGHDGKVNTLPEQTTETYNAKITVIKKDGNNAALGGAGFVLKNANGKYYAKAEDGTVSWVDSIGAATELTTAVVDGVAKVEFTGLADGTYTLVENTVPEGYNKAPDETITIAAHDYSAENLQQEKEVINNAGSTLPSTGGMGTTLFYVFGGILVAAAVVLLVTKKRVGEAQ